MKKAFAIILTFTVLFLCACNRNNQKDVVDTPTESTTEFVPVKLTLPTTTTVPTTQAVYFSAWPSDLIPDKFPDPPEGSYAFKLVKGEADKHEGDFASDWIRIGFDCPEQNFHTFTNKMSELGYIGGSKKITEGEFYTDGYKGYWQDGKNIVKIFKTTKNSDSSITVIIDIVPCGDYFPEALTQYFPKFSGYTASTGEYCGYDASKTPFTDTFEDTFPEYWYWEYRFSKCFVGVTLEDFEGYYKALGDAGFSGVISNATVDGCDIISIDVTKVIDEDTYAVYMLFNQTLRTLDIAYTNDTTLYVSD